MVQRNSCPDNKFLGFNNQFKSGQVCKGKKRQFIVNVQTKTKCLAICIHNELQRKLKDKGKRCFHDH